MIGINAAKALGAYYTPPELVRSLCSWAIRRPTDRVLDPACGDGVFLEEAAKVAVPSPSLQLDGFDIDAQACSAARRRLDRYGARIERRDFFEVCAESMHRTGTAPEYDCVVGNPPFIRYQRFPPAQKAMALELCRRLGVTLNHEVSSWAPFVALSAAWLAPRGRMAMIVPREALFVNYAHALFGYLKRYFGTLEVLVLDGFLFRDALVKVAVLLGEKNPPRPTGFRIREIRSLEEVVKKDPPGPLRTDGSFSWTWSRIPRRCLDPVAGALRSPAFGTLESVASVRLGVVTGDKDFFVMSDEEIHRRGLERKHFRPVVASPSCLEGSILSEADLDVLRRRNEPCNLLSVRETPPHALQRYIAFGRREGVADRYKCRIRKPWYVLDAGSPPHAFLGYLCSGRPRFAVNASRWVSTNNVHRVTFRRMDPSRRAAFAAAFYNPLTLLSIELIGRMYGGGVLKIEPGDAERIRVLSPERIAPLASPRRNVLAVDALLRSGHEREAYRRVVEWISPVTGLSPGVWRRVEEAYWALREQRVSVRRGQPR